MARYARQLLPAPLGMAPALDPAEIPITRARLIRGFTPARNGKLSLSTPLQRILQTDSADAVSGVAYYYNPRPATQDEFNAGIFRPDRLVVVKNGINVYLHTVSFSVDTEDFVFGAAVFLGQILDVRTGGRPENQNIRTVQYKDEMFIVAGDGSIPQRLFMDQPSDTPHLYRCGIVAPVNAPSPSSTGGGAVTGNVSYYYTWGDEKLRESSPSPAGPFSAGGNTVSVVFEWSTDPQVQHVYVYRTTSGGVVGYRIADITNTAVTSYSDNDGDVSISSNTVMPAIGSNEPPQRASCLELHKSRLFFNDRNIYDDATDINSLTKLQMSNLDAPTQFNIVPENIQENSELGLQMVVGNRNSDEITGLKSNGSVLAIPTRAGMYHLYGDDVDTFLIRYQHDVGCVAIDSFVEGDGALFYLTDTAIVMTTFEEGFIPRVMSIEIDSIFSGDVLAYVSVSP